MKKTTLKMELFSQRELDENASASQLALLGSFEGGMFRPSRCDTAEPPRERFDPNDLREPIRWLSQPGTDFQFKQTKPIQIEGFISNRRRRQLFTREHKGGPLVPIVPKFPEPLFITQWVLWFSLKAAKARQLAILGQFLKEAFLVSASEYGYLALEEDQKSKNFLVTVDKQITTTKFVGNDPENGVPGLYWINVFGPTYTEWFGSALDKIPATVEALPGGATIIQFGGSPEDWQTKDVVARQQSAIDLLGRDKFFDLAHPTRPCRTPFPTIETIGDRRDAP